MYIHIGHDLVAGRQTDHILNGPSFGGPVTFWNLIYRQPEALALLRKEQHGVMGTGDQNMFYKIPHHGLQLPETFTSPP